MHPGGRRGADGAEVAGGQLEHVQHGEGELGQAARLPDERIEPHTQRLRHLLKRRFEAELALGEAQRHDEHRGLTRR